MLKVIIYTILPYMLGNPDARDLMEFYKYVLMEERPISDATKMQLNINTFYYNYIGANSFVKIQMIKRAFVQNTQI